MDEIEQRLAAVERLLTELIPWLDPGAIEDAAASIRAGLTADVGGDERTVRVQALSLIEEGRLRLHGPQGRDHPAFNIQAPPGLPDEPASSPLPLLFQATQRPPTLVELAGMANPVAISTMLRRETRWCGPTPATFRSVPNKPPLLFNDQPIWAEFILLRLLESAGWEGVWVNNWRRAFWRDVLDAVELPPPARSLFDRISSRTGGRSGCWDVFAWRGDDVLFVESKQRGKDRLRPTQLTWLEGALAEGVPLGSFAIVEWSIP